MTRPRAPMIVAMTTSAESNALTLAGLADGSPCNKSETEGDILYLSARGARYHDRAAKGVCRMGRGGAVAAAQGLRSTASVGAAFRAKCRSACEYGLCGSWLGYRMRGGRSWLACRGCLFVACRWLYVCSCILLRIDTASLTDSCDVYRLYACMLPALYAVLLVGGRRACPRVAHLPARREGLVHCACRAQAHAQ